jgi:hypothetical protein
MKVVKRLLKWLAVTIIVLIVALQFIRPARTNPSSSEAESARAHLQMDAEVAAIIDRSCSDCHSNATRWPWYSQVAPVSWFVIDHVNHGRSHLNFSEWGKYNRHDSRELLEGICKEVRTGAMPLSSYTRIHRDAVLNEADRETLCEWARAEKSRLSSQ